MNLVLHSNSKSWKKDLRIEMADLRPPASWVGGYDRLSAYISRYPYQGIYRKFSALHAKRLLYLQAELTKIENDLNIVCTLDANEDDKRLRGTGDSWKLLNEMADETTPRVNFQARLVKKAHEVLQEYRMKEIIHRKARLKSDRCSTCARSAGAGLAKAKTLRSRILACMVRAALPMWL